MRKLCWQEDSRASSCFEGLAIEQVVPDSRKTAARKLPRSRAQGQGQTHILQKGIPGGATGQLRCAAAWKRLQSLGIVFPRSRD